MSNDSAATLRATIATAVGEASRAGRPLPTAVEASARDYARAQRAAGQPVEKLIIEMKELVRREAPAHELVFIPRLVGWTVAGYFARRTSGETESGD